MRRLLQIFAGLLPLVSVAPVSAAEPTDTVKIVSYNIRAGVGMDDVRDFRRQAAVIDTRKADVVLLQEVDSLTRRSGRVNMPDTLAAATGLSHYFSKSIDFDGGAYGIAMLLKDKPLAVTRYPLPGREEARSLLIAEMPGYVVACTHLSLTPADQITSAGIIALLADTYSKPFILGGDLNATPGSPTIRRLEQAGFRIVSADRPTYPASTPSDRIDYIMVHDPAATVKAVDAAVVDAPEASDHRPISVTLIIPKI